MTPASVQAPTADYIVVTGTGTLVDIEIVSYEGPIAYNFGATKPVYNAGDNDDLQLDQGQARRMTLDGTTADQVWVRSIGLNPVKVVFVDPT